MIKVLSLPSPEASRCCSTDCQYSDGGTLCLRGDLDIGGCQNASHCKYPYIVCAVMDPVCTGVGTRGALGTHAPLPHQNSAECMPLVVMSSPSPV